MSAGKVDVLAVRFSDWQSHWRGSEGWRFSALSSVDGLRHTFEHYGQLQKEHAHALVAQLNRSADLTELIEAVGAAQVNCECLRAHPRLREALARVQP